MYNQTIHSKLNDTLLKAKLDLLGADNSFYTRAIANIDSMVALYNDIYPLGNKNYKVLNEILNGIIVAHQERPKAMKKRDAEKSSDWFLSNSLAGMSLYVDRFCGNIENLSDKLSYFKKLGVNLLHLMPIFESPEGESDGGYAVSNFREVDKRFGSINDLHKVRENMDNEGMYLMLDIVLNHTSYKHEWAQKAKAGKKEFQEYYYMYDDRTMPYRFEQTMPEVFPESSPGNFTFDEQSGKWVMTVFNYYQWDLNYTNPVVLKEMLSTIFFYANLGVDVLRIDAPAFIWKQLGTSSQNLPQAHTLLQFIKLCVEVAAPGMAILGEAIVAPKEIMKYFGSGIYTAHECDFAYNATHMALQWDMLATGETRVMLAAQRDLLQKPLGTTWINYTRCHDDIGLGYEDAMIQQAGYDPQMHRSFMKNYYSGIFEGSTAMGALFGFNPKTGDARISGTLASLCGLEKAIDTNDPSAIDAAIQRISLMQAHSFLLGGVPMIFYGDEVGYTNDYNYLNDPGKSYDNRWMHRPIIDWAKNDKINSGGTIENRIFSATQKLLTIRAGNSVFSDLKNLTWLNTHNIHIAGYVRTLEEKQLFCLFNFSNKAASMPWYAIKESGIKASSLHELWTDKRLSIGSDQKVIVLSPYEFMILESR